MKAIKNEYMDPSQEYAKKDKLPALWNARMKKILDLDDVISEKPLPDELARLVARRKKIFNKSNLNEYRIENP